MLSKALIRMAVGLDCNYVCKSLSIVYHLFVQTANDSHVQTGDDSQNLFYSI